MAESDDRMCSTVCTRIEPSPMVVARSTVFRFAMVASMVGSSSRSLRLNLMPESTGAGCNLRVTFSPVCNDVPLTLALRARVC